jgi:hypothetical protein
VKFEVHKAVKMLIVVVWVVMQCSLVGGYQLFGGPYRIHLEVNQHGDVKCLYRRRTASGHLYLSSFPLASFIDASLPHSNSLNPEDGGNMALKILVIAYKTNGVTTKKIASDKFIFGVISNVNLQYVHCENIFAFSLNVAKYMC